MIIDVIIIIIIIIIMIIIINELGIKVPAQ